jgi:hypothetical protein
MYIFIPGATILLALIYIVIPCANNPFSFNIAVSGATILLALIYIVISGATIFLALIIFL